MAKTAPMTCPQCGAEREWRCQTDPSTGSDEKKGFWNVLLDTLSFYFFGLLGSLIFKGVTENGAKVTRVHYRCEKCGFEGKYRPD